MSRATTAAINGVLTNPVMNSLTPVTEFPDTEGSWEHLTTYFGSTGQE